MLGSSDNAVDGCMLGSVDKEGMNDGSADDNDGSCDADGSLLGFDEGASDETVDGLVLGPIDEPHQDR